DFEGRVSGLPFEDQRNLLQLMMRQIRVNRLDPAKDRIPAGPHSWDTKIRTQWYSVNLDFFATDLFSVITKKATEGSQIATSGGTGGIRTLGSLLGYVPLARECFRPLSHRSGKRVGRVEP